MKLLKEVKKYCNDIIDSRINACQKHVWSCQRFLRDLKNQGDGKFEFVFDEEKALNFVEWSKFFKHSKGILAGKKIELTPFQLFLAVNIYGWYHKDTGYRRFTKAYIQVGRKNAKSQFLSLIATYELMVFPHRRAGSVVSEVYCAATTKEQAKIVYDEAKIMLERCKELKGKWREAYRRIEHIKSKSIIRPLSREDRKTGDGLNPQCGIIDEYHAHESNEVYKIIESGMGARPEPLLPIITTAGLDLNNPCYRVEYSIATQILDPGNPINLENYFAIICELEVNQTSEDIEVNGRKISPGELIDDIKDEDNWIKANPIAATYPEGIKNIKEALQEALIAPDNMRNYLTKRMNVWVNQRESGYMNLEKWKSCYVMKEFFPSIRGCSAFVGLDLSAKHDLTSIGLVFPEIKDGKNAVLSHSFIPEDKLNERVMKDKMPFDSWVERGFVTMTDGAVVNYKQVMQYTIDWANSEGFYIEEICMDPWGSHQLSNDFIDLGYLVVDIIQGPKTLSEPTKDFRNQVYDNNVIHDNNPVLAWAIGNAVVDMKDRNENIILNKVRSRDRIDPVASVINAWVRSMVRDDSYNTREMRGFDV